MMIIACLFQVHDGSPVLSNELNVLNKEKTNARKELECLVCLQVPKVGDLSIVVE